MEDPSISDSDEYLPQIPHPRQNSTIKETRVLVELWLNVTKNIILTMTNQNVTKITVKFKNLRIQNLRADKKSMKGELYIKTVSFPKRVRARTFKCQICKFICHSEKERNKHHKDNHGPLTRAVCKEGFNTPSGLHRHKYHHTDLKFTCETCGERFPFESQLKDH